MMMLFTSNPQYLQGLLDVQLDDNRTVSSCSVNEDVYCDLIQDLYTPPSYRGLGLSFDEIRQLSISNPMKKDTESSGSIRHPQTWLPPKSALRKLSKLTNSMVQYLLTAGHHSADLPDFLNNGCLQITDDGSIVYDLGPECRVTSPQQLLIIPAEDLKTKIKEAQKSKRNCGGKQVKRSLVLTPHSIPRHKRPNLSSTPKSSVSASGAPNS
jgi:hypothetical protein